jgi:hypothetical protein
LTWAWSSGRRPRRSPPPWPGAELALQVDRLALARAQGAQAGVELLAALVEPALQVGQRGAPLLGRRVGLRRLLLAVLQGLELGVQRGGGRVGLGLGLLGGTRARLDVAVELLQLGHLLLERRPAVGELLHLGLELLALGGDGGDARLALAGEGRDARVEARLRLGGLGPRRLELAALADRAPPAGHREDRDGDEGADDDPVRVRLHRPSSRAGRRRRVASMRVHPVCLRSASAVVDQCRAGEKGAPAARRARGGDERDEVRY